jgi:hypothetical protein
MMLLRFWGPEVAFISYSVLLLLIDTDLYLRFLDLRFQRLRVLDKPNIFRRVFLKHLSKFCIEGFWFLRRSFEFLMNCCLLSLLELLRCLEWLVLWSISGELECLLELSWEWRRGRGLTDLFKRLRSFLYLLLSQSLWSVHWFWDQAVFVVWFWWF